jgi:hypothetical protein
VSITFSIVITVDGEMRFAYHCDCQERWCEACDEAWAKGVDAPDEFFCADCTDVTVNMSNANAREWLRWIGLPADDCGEIGAMELAARCRRRLWDETRNYDPAVEGSDHKTPGHARLIVCDRRPNYLREKTEQMLKICEKAGDRLISWG